MSVKISSGTIGNRTHDLQACSAVPQTTVVKCNVYLTNFIFGIILKIGVQFYFSSKLLLGLALLRLLDRCPL